jgi:single-stranded-DNA-specific exonuclease
MRAVAFGRGDWADELEAIEGPICISFAPNINRFQGRERVELQLIDWHPGPHAPLAGSPPPLSPS